MVNRPGLALLILAPLILLSLDIGRHVLPRQDVPSFFAEEPPALQIQVEGGGLLPGIYQFSDVVTVQTVINMTDLGPADVLLNNGQNEPPLESGEKLVFQVVEGKVQSFERGWMTAAQRVALGIPLHPDRMALTDWDDLPGIGESLAAAIEDDRQKNGDYGRVSALLRVRGIGPGKMKRLKPFF